MRPATFAKAAFVFGAVALALALGRYITEPVVVGMPQIIDGDSLRVDARELRLSGIDAPELYQTCERSGREVACGREAREALRGLIAGGTVNCRLTGKDRYGRDLARCKMGEIDINAGMVRAGHAVAFGAYQAQEDEAKTARRGLWAGRFDTPQSWRQAHPRPFRAQDGSR